MSSRKRPSFAEAQTPRTAIFRLPPGTLAQALLAVLMRRGMARPVLLRMLPVGLFRAQPPLAEWPADTLVRCTMVGHGAAGVEVSIEEVAP